MPGAKGGKNKNKNTKKKAIIGEGSKRELVFKEDGQDYAIVEKMLGNGMVSVLCNDGVKRIAHIRGAMRKKVWISTSDLVLLGLRDYQDNKADVILKYTADEARMLKSYGELSDIGLLGVAGGEKDGEGLAGDDLLVEFGEEEVGAGAEYQSGQGATLNIDDI